MKVITLRDELPYSVETVWKILSDVTRCDWVPSVDSIVLQDNIRKFKMDGIGEIQEKILVNDADTYRLQYSAIKTPSPLTHHLATIDLEKSGESCILNWNSEIEPEEFGVAGENGMRISLDGLKQVLADAD